MSAVSILHRRLPLSDPLDEIVYYYSRQSEIWLCFRQPATAQVTLASQPRSKLELREVVLSGFASSSLGEDQCATSGITYRDR